MKRLFIILLFALLMLAVIAVVMRITLDIDHRASLAPVPADHQLLVVAPERETFARKDLAARYAGGQHPVAASRTLQQYYRNRAYPGAPPVVPHPVAAGNTIGGKDCLKCHQNGGYAAPFKAYTPITPHPQLVSCLQCHVPQYPAGGFKASNWQPPAPPATGTNQALPGSPPVIPHDLQMRNNCLSCHAGPAAPQEIRVTHPERINCRQCHVVNRPGDSGSFPEITNP